MGENTSAKGPRMAYPSWGVVLTMAMVMPVAVGAGAASSSHDPITGMVVGAAIFMIMIISSALVFRRRPR
jgi:Na+/melibiose symporter-like transporter